MDVDELLQRAWAAVEKAGVPPEVQGVALKEAIAFLRDGAEPNETKPNVGATGSAKRAATKRSIQKRAVSRAPQPREASTPMGVTEDDFFRLLASESGVEETDLRDILHFTSDGRVQVTPPTKDLGSSVAEQAKTVIALVASARSKGLGERPVNAGAVRREAERKHCYLQNNFASKHLAPLKGFNAGGKNELHLTSKWVDEFTIAVNKVHGRAPAESA